jgi:dTDP-glucose 4,6-dehydratase
MSQPTILLTGGSGFIGSALVLHLLEHTDYRVVNVDVLTYAANPLSLAAVEGHERYRFYQGNIGDRALLSQLLQRYQPVGVMHLAAESHVDRSIEHPENFVETNVNGTVSVLQAALGYYKTLKGTAREAFRFHHISTDEVFGSLHPEDPAFEETTPYAPRSPYAASKAASDHFVQAWHHTYGLPVVITNCSNNYGPRQSIEKLIPMMIARALNGETLPVYGDGQQRRDWLFVEDHAEALCRVFENGRSGQTYNIGGLNNPTNLEIVTTVCGLLDKMVAKPEVQHRSLIKFVTDRPGHDRRYAMNCSLIESETGWKPCVSLEDGLRTTVQWYLDNRNWWEDDYASLTLRKGLANAA